MFGLSSDVLAIGALGLVLVAGLVLDGLLALVALWRMRAPADGTVTGYEWRNPEGEPVVEYVDAGGTRHHFRASRDGYLKTGDRIPVAYDARAPHRARIATPMGSYRRPLAALVLAPVVLAMTLAMVERQDRGTPADRLQAYLALHQATDRLNRCRGGSCSPATIQRRLRAYTRASRAAEPVVSSRVRARMADVRRGLARGRAGRSSLRAVPIAPLWAAVQVDMLDVVTGNDPGSSAR